MAFEENGLPYDKASQFPKELFEKFKTKSRESKNIAEPTSALLSQKILSSISKFKKSPASEK